MSASKWFIQLRGTVQGPFNNENLNRALETMGHDNASQALVWKKGLNEWIYSSQWQRAEQQIESQTKNPAPLRKMETAVTTIAPQQSAVGPMPPPIERTELMANLPHDNATQATTISPSRNAGDNAQTTVQDDELFEKTFTQAFADGVFYRVQVNFVDQPLMSRNELMQLIARHDDLSTISIQDPKTKEWKEIFTFPDLVEKLGISRRKTTRVPILAQFNGKTSKSQNVSYRVITISEGGMGFTENFDLKIGDEVEGQISSPHFFQPISVKADVIYAGLDGYIGLKFSNITDETKSAVVEYVRKFGKASKS